MSDDPSLGDQVRNSLHGFVEGVGRALGIDVNAPDPDDERGDRDAYDLAAGRMIDVTAAGTLVGAAPMQALSAPVRGPWEITQNGDGTATLSNGVESCHCKSLAFAQAVRTSLRGIADSKRGRR